MLDRDVNRDMSTAVAWQAFYYVLAFLLVHLLSTIALIWWWAARKWNDTLDLYAWSILLSLQGVWNLVIFTRNRNMLTPEGRFFQTLIWCKYCRTQRN